LTGQLAQSLPLNSVETLQFTPFGPKDKPQFSTFESQIQTNLLIGTPTLPKYSFAMKRRRKPNMETYALLEDALSPLLSSRSMASLVKKQKQLQNAWLPA
jgi:hypothetical protein